MVRRIVLAAFALLPGAPGAGEGPTQAAVDSLTDALLALRQLTRPELPVPEWLGIAFAVGTTEAEHEAALVIRDELVEGSLDELAEVAPATLRAEAAERDESLRVAEAFGTVG
jgi:hypothetical protein